MKSFCSFEMNWLRSERVLIMTCSSLFLLYIICTKLVGTSIWDCTFISYMLDWTFIVLYISLSISIDLNPCNYWGFIKYYMSCLCIASWRIDLLFLFLILSFILSFSSWFYKNFFIIFKNRWLWGKHLLFL
jgi:hypothetical protein